MRLGEMIAAYRKEHKLSQRQFAKKCGDMSNGYVSMLENDYNPATGKGITPTIDKLICIASGMDMSLSELIERADDMPVDISEVVAQNVIYADEDDAEICEMFIHLEKKRKEEEAERKKAIAANKKTMPSAQAMSIAHAYDRMSAYGRAIIDEVIKQEKMRKGIMTAPLVKELELKQDGTAEVKVVAAMERRETENLQQEDDSYHTDDYSSGVYVID